MLENKVHLNNQATGVTGLTGYIGKQRLLEFPFKKSEPLDSHPMLEYAKIV
jgi:hypothetical protein